MVGIFRRSGGVESGGPGRGGVAGCGLEGECGRRGVVSDGGGCREASGRGAAAAAELYLVLWKREKYIQNPSQSGLPALLVVSEVVLAVLREAEGVLQAPV